MRFPMLLFAASLAFASLAGCNQYLRPGELSPLKAQVALEQRTRIWQEAIDVLLDEGYVPNVLDPLACYISAKQRDDVQVGSLTGTMTIVTISPEGRLRVEVSGQGIYASSSSLVHDLEAVQTKLRDEILARAARLSATPPAAAPAA